MGNLCSCFDVRDEPAGSVESNFRSAVFGHISHFLNAGFSSQFHKVSQLISRSNDDNDGATDELKKADYDEDSKKNLLESSVKQLSSYICLTAEDYFPTGYEGYFLGNPMRILQCPHYFHHCRIYDWPDKCPFYLDYFDHCRKYDWAMRSEICPLCRKLTAQFQRGQVLPVPSSTPIRATVVPSSSADLTTVPFDNPKFLHLQPQSGTAASIIGKVSSQFHEVSQLSLGNDDNGVTDELKKPDYDEDSKKNLLESSVKQPSEKAGSGCSYICPPVEDEDDCAICLKKYTLGNPKKKLQCSHHFHLSCIYEWLERSETCPFCRKSADWRRKSGGENK